MSLRALAVVKNIFQDSFIPKIMSLAFLSQKFTQDLLPVNPYEHVKEFNNFKFYCFPFKPEKNTNGNLYVFKSFQYTQKSSPKGKDRSPESNVPMSNVVFSAPRKDGVIIFPIISQWGFSVAMETRVLIQSASNP